MLYLKLTILISSVRIVHAMNKGKVMKHKLSAILMAFMLTTPAAFAAPGADTGAEASTTAGTTSATTTATTGGVAAGAVGTATVAGVATAVGVAALAVVAANDSGDGGSHNTSTTTSTR
ncbi:inner membrane protein [Escherichia albertii]|nr:inner membrane protein [Escherichia coli]